jgi:hypothetical protein
LPSRLLGGRELDSGDQVFGHVPVEEKAHEVLGHVRQRGPERQVGGDPEQDVALRVPVALALELLVRHRLDLGETGIGLERALRGDDAELVGVPGRAERADRSRRSHGRGAGGLQPHEHLGGEEIRGIGRVQPDGIGRRGRRDLRQPVPRVRDHALDQ